MTSSAPPPGPRSLRRCLAWILLAGGLAILWTLGIPNAELRQGTRKVIGDLSNEVSRTDGLTQQPSRMGLRGLVAMLGRGGRGSSNPRDPGAARDPLRDWLQRYESASPEERGDLLKEGQHWAEQRRLRMVGLIREDPRRALQESLGWDEFQRLPVPIRARVERPFSGVADYTVYPGCGVRGRRAVLRGELLFEDGTRAEGFVSGWRRGMGTKSGWPIQGIQVDGMAAVREDVFQRISAEDLAVVRAWFPLGQTDPRRGLAAGRPVVGEGVEALAGGKRFVFESEAELAGTNAAFAKLEAMPGPRGGSSWLCAKAADRGALLPPGIPLREVQQWVRAAASDWTLTPKRVFLIRVDFEDVPGEPVAQEAAEAVLRGATREALEGMSYGKTTLSAKVSSSVYRIPGARAVDFSGKSRSDYDEPNFRSRNRELLEAARSVFRKTKHGEDAAVDIGPEPVGGGVEESDLGDYDVVGVCFAGIGCKDSGFEYSGLASLGGRNLWMQGDNSASVYTHELGHIYGLGHSNFWETSDGSVVGAGVEEEYGDIFDVMGDGEVPAGHFHPQAKARLSWLSESQWQEVTESGDYQIYRVDDPRTQGTLRGLKIPRGLAGGLRGEAADFFWVGYRAAYPQNDPLSLGAYLLWEQADSTHCVLLDTTPGSAEGKSDAALVLGRTFTDPKSGVSITPIAAGGSGSDQWLRVRVIFSTGVQNLAPLVAPAIAGPQTARARSETTFSIAASDPENHELSYHWDPGDGSVSERNGLGASKFTHRWVVGGTYTLRVSVSDLRGQTVTRSQKVVVSDPALEWSRVLGGASLGGDRLRGMVASPHLVVGVGMNGALWTSADGQTWRKRALTESVRNLHFEAVGWDGRRFVAVGKDYVGAEWVGVVYVSDSGERWERQWVLERPDSGLKAVACGKGVWVAVGGGGTILRSEEGLQWELISVPGLDSNATVSAVAYGNGSFLASALDTIKTSAGWENPGGGSLARSVDGRAWLLTATGHKAQGGPALRSLAFVKDRFLGSSWYSGLRTSTDGQSFRSYGDGSDEWTAFAAGPDFYWASGVAGGDSAEERALQFFSLAGQRWSRVEGPSEIGRVSGAVVFNGRLLLAGDDGAIYASSRLGISPNRDPEIQSLTLPSAVAARRMVSMEAVASDPDGDSLTYVWEELDSGQLQTGRVCVLRWGVGGTYSVRLTVLDGRGGVAAQTRTVSVSDPAQAFDEVHSGTGVPLYAVASSGSLVVAAGSLGTVASSADGLAWKTSSVGSPTDSSYVTLRSTVWDGTRFVAVGEGPNFEILKRVGVIYVSRDGLNWERKYLGDRKNTMLRTVAAGGGVLVAGGDSNLVLRSRDGGENWESVTVWPGASTQSVQGLAYGSGTFLMTSLDVEDLGDRFSYPGSGRISRSRDGLRWSSKVADDVVEDLPMLRKVAFLRDRFVGSSWWSRLRVSTDEGLSFQTNRQAVEEISGWVEGGGLYFGAGVELRDDSGRESNRSVFLLSEEGQSWRQIRSPGAVRGVESAAFHQGHILLVGGTGRIWRSGPMASGALPLEILVAPVGGRTAVGERVDLSVVARGSGTLTYQWYCDGAPLSQERASRLSFWMSPASGEGDYSVEVSDSSGQRVLSAKATVRRISEGSAPSVVTIAGARKVLAGTRWAWEAVSQGTDPLSYQWLLRGIPIAGEIGVSLTRDVAELAHAGSYSVQVSNAWGSAISEEVALEIVSPPSFSQQPKGGFFKLGETLRLSVGASSEAVSYQWFKNQEKMVGATQSTYSIGRLSPEDSGSYWVEITGEGGKTQSSRASVTVFGIEGVAGIYEGLLRDAEQRLKGRVTLSLTATQTYSVSVVLGSRRMAFSGVLSQGNFGKSVHSEDGAGKWLVSGQMASDFLSGNVSVLSLEGETALYTASLDRLPYSGVYPAPMAGLFTLSMTEEENESSVGPPAKTMGLEGYGLGRVTPSGWVSLVGRIRGGGVFTQRAVLNWEGRACLFGGLFVEGRETGYLGGEAQFVVGAEGGGLFTWNSLQQRAQGGGGVGEKRLVARAFPFRRQAVGEDRYEVSEKPVQVSLGSEGGSWVSGEAFWVDSRIVLGGGQSRSVFDGFAISASPATGEVQGTVVLRWSGGLPGRLFRLRGVVVQSEGSIMGFWERTDGKGYFRVEPR